MAASWKHLTGACTPLLSALSRSWLLAFRDRDIDGLVKLYCSALGRKEALWRE